MVIESSYPAPLNVLLQNQQLAHSSAMPPIMNQRTSPRCRINPYWLHEQQPTYALSWKLLPVCPCWTASVKRRSFPSCEVPHALADRFCDPATPLLIRRGASIGGTFFTQRAARRRSGCLFLPWCAWQSTGSDARTDAFNR